MKVTVKLKDIVETLPLQADEAHHYLDRETGEIVLVMDEELEAAERGDRDRYPEWQQEVILLAEQIIADEDDRFVALPSKLDIHEYHIMENFCGSVNDPKIADDLYVAIRGSGAFRRFRGQLHYHSLLEAWNEYLEAALTKIAIAWCEDEGIACS